jgi:malonyl-CoA decarboxylase
MTKSITLLKKRKAPLKAIKPDKITTLLNQFKTAITQNDFDATNLEKLRNSYYKLSTEEKSLFFSGMLEKIEIPKKEIKSLLKKYLAVVENDPEWSYLFWELHDKFESPRLKLFRKFINISEGLPFLLSLRNDILKIQRKTSKNFSVLDKELSHLFNSWFQNGFLALNEISQTSPYNQIAYVQGRDMVHPMNRLEEMGDRLGVDRRCFALYHLAMPNEPVVFIEVALTIGITRSIHDIIGKQTEKEKKSMNFDTAIFYSINNTQNGLAGIGLGKLLIFQVVDLLKRTVPEVKTFSTLSPIPGFWKKYLEAILTQKETRFKLTKEQLEEFFPKKLQNELKKEFEKKNTVRNQSFTDILHKILVDPNWIENEVYLKKLKKPLKEIVYYYLVEEKDVKGNPANPVANFHMSNGANVAKSNINFLANRSEKGISESCGMMVNYVYSQNWFHQVREWGWQSGLPIK